MKNTRKGFTLVELLVVIAILAVLATVSVVGYVSFINRANDSNAATEFEQIQSYIEADLMVDKKWEFEDEDGNKYAVVQTGTHLTAKKNDNPATLGSVIAACADLNVLGGTITVDGDGVITYTRANGKGTATWEGMTAQPDSEISGGSEGGEQPGEGGGSEGEDPETPVDPNPGETPVDPAPCTSICEICDKCTDEDCTEHTDKCEGHETAPAHECESVCPDCQKCLDGECREDACVVKCDCVPAPEEMSLLFTESLIPNLGTVTLGGIEWTVDGTTEEAYFNFDTSEYHRGQQFGSDKKPFTSVVLTSEAFANVTKVVVNASGANRTDATLTVTVGGVQIGETITLTTAATNYTFTSDTALDGAIVITYTQTAGKAMYIKELCVNADPHTCQFEGATCEVDAVCTLCKVKNEGSALTHTWGEGTITTEATCTEDGVRTYTCSTVGGCGGTTTEKIDATGHSVTSGTCPDCGETVVAATKETITADFNTVTNTNTSYGKHTTTNKWVANNCAVVKGGTTDANPTFKVIGDENNRGFVLNGKTSAVGSIVSPTLKNGLESISFKYTNVFAENNGVDITITVKQNGTVVATKRIDNDSVTQLTAYNVVWDLDEAISGEYTIEIVNNSPSKSTSNKDRVAIWDLTYTTNP